MCPGASWVIAPGLVGNVSRASWVIAPGPVGNVPRASGDFQAQCRLPDPFNKPSLHSIFPLPDTLSEGWLGLPAEAERVVLMDTGGSACGWLWFRAPSCCPAAETQIPRFSEDFPTICAQGFPGPEASS